MFDKKDMKELIVDCKAPDEMANAKVIDAFRTPSSESYLVEVGSFSDGARMYVMAERFESTGWKWSNSFPEMDAWQMADYLEGYSRLPDIDNWADYEQYTKGLREIAKKLRRLHSLMN